MNDREEIVRHLRTEIAALETRMDSKNHLILSLREQLSAHETHRADERRTQVFRRAVIDIVPEEGMREFASPSPVGVSRTWVTH